MMKTVWTYFRHFLVVLLLMGSVAIGVGIWLGADFDLGDNMTAWKIGDEGPHVFLENGRWVQKTLRGSRDEGFTIEEKSHAADESFPLEVQFPLDNSRFSLIAKASFETPPVRYQDDEPILAISDIEGNYKTFRDFLIKANVIDADLNWTFARGHLVLVGDFVDRGASTTQVLWLIYKLEQAAVQQGGRVHFVLGNHELKNLQGNFQSAHKKYVSVAGMLGKQQSDLFGDPSFIGQWLMSKNSAELINGLLFVHGGLHPALADTSLSLEELNRRLRAGYRQMWYPKKSATPGALLDDLLGDTQKGPSWYRGYFNDDLTQAEVEKTLETFGARAIVVGHTPVWRIKSLFQKKVFAIDVKHPLDYRWSFPPRSSEGLRVEQEKFWRVTADGEQEGL